MDPRRLMQRLLSNINLMLTFLLLTLLFGGAQTGFARAPKEAPKPQSEETEIPDALDFDVLGDAMIVVAANGVMGVLLDPVDAGAGLGAVIDEIAKEEAEIVWFLDGLEGRTIAVNVRDQQDPHGASLPRF